MLCTNGHNNPDSAGFCGTCGIDTFHPHSQMMMPSSYFAPAPRTNGNAIASLVCGLVWTLGVTSIVAIVLGFKAKREIAATHEGGDGMATAGIVLGFVGLAGGILYVSFFLIVFFAAAGGASHCFANSTTYPC